MFKFLKCQSVYQVGYWKRNCIVNLRNYQIGMKFLNVAEKNDAAKTIAGLLSNGTARRREGYSVYNKIYEFEAVVKGTKSKMIMTSVSGHLLEHAFLNSYKNWNNVDPIALFDAPIRKICKSDFEPIKRTLEREIRSCGGLIIWTDCDREGENIGFEIIDVCRAIKPNIVVHRAVFSEITTAAVRRAVQNLKTPDKRLNDAVEVRSELDLRTGAAITRFQTLRFTRLFPQKIAGNLISYGSCQIPTMGFVAERYKEIEAFISEPFWKIKVLHTIEDLTVEFLWARNRLFDKQACEDYLLLCLADPKAKVESVTVKPKNKWRPTPMDTVEMEKLGSRKLKLSAKETMTIAEKLYTKGIISYPRTETNQFTNDIDLRSLVEQQTGHNGWGAFAQRVMEWGPNPRNGNKSDQAHPPIHPTKLVTNLQGNEARVYELVCRHFLACVSKDAVGSETIVHINIAGEKFSATGLCIFERNYLDVYIYEKWNAKQIHRYEEGQIFDPTEISMHEGKTTAPPLLTEADLIALMEKHGIGTDATHAEHINTIKERGYIGVIDKGFLIPGVIGMGLYEGYDAMQLALAKPMLRAEFEADLKKICTGEKDPKIVLSEQVLKYKESYKKIMEKINMMDEKMASRLNETPANSSNSASDNNPSNINATTESRQIFLKEIFPCPKCKIASLALKPKKNQTSFYIGCLNYPECKNVVWLPEECSEPTVLDENCQKCGPDVKLIKIKFNSMYYRTLFNAPSGRYKTCLLCDSKFREAFCINLENVKNTGNIVSDQRSTDTTERRTARTTRTTNNATTSNQTSSLPSTSLGSLQGSGAGNADRRQQTKSKIKKAPSKSTKIENANIRTYFTNATTNIKPITTDVTETIVGSRNELQDIEALFDSNDGFEEIVLSNDLDIQNTRETETASRENENIRRTDERRNMDDADGDTVANVVAAFNNGDDDDDDDPFGVAATNRNNKNSTQFSNLPNSNNNNTSRSTACDDSFAELLRSDEIDFGNFSWGTGSLNALHPKPKRQCVEDATIELRKNVTSNYNKINENLMNSAGSTRAIDNGVCDVKCTGCHQLAKMLTVKKEGPNKGRGFYVCHKSNPCKFFQWADESNNNANTAGKQENNTQSSSSSLLSVGHSTDWNNSRILQRNSSNNSDNDYNWGASTSSTYNNNHSMSAANNWGTQPQRAQPKSSNWNNTSSSVSKETTNLNNEHLISNCDDIKCNCGAKASSLIVRKDGPNKGRPFYACQNRTCGFFKWADDDSNHASSSTSMASSSVSGWGSGARSRNAANDNGDDGGGGSGDVKKRKCGLCRQTGHTRQKCPRKTEFEF